MARKRKAKRSRVASKIAKSKGNVSKRNKTGFVVKRSAKIGAARLQRGLLVLSETKDLKAAARAIRVSSEKFKRAAKRKSAITQSSGRWQVAKRLQRRMPIFTNGKQLAISVRSRSASLIGRYMAAVGKFLRTNDPAPLTDFIGHGVKDIRGQLYPFETNPNVLYRLSSAGGEPFESVYRLII